MKNVFTMLAVMLLAGFVTCPAQAHENQQAQDTSDKVSAAVQKTAAQERDFQEKVASLERVIQKAKARNEENDASVSVVVLFADTLLKQYKEGDEATTQALKKALGAETPAEDRPVMRPFNPEMHKQIQQQRQRLQEQEEKHQQQMQRALQRPHGEQMMRLPMPPIKRLTSDEARPVMRPFNPEMHKQIQQQRQRLQEQEEKHQQQMQRALQRPHGEQMMRLPMPPMKELPAEEEAEVSTDEK